MMEALRSARNNSIKKDNTLTASIMPHSPTDWLPTSAREVQARGWDSLDVILFSGDAYIDHPSFGMAVVGRLLEAAGLRVAIVPQPNWRDDLRDFTKLGKPRLFFGVSAGNMDSMVNHYTAGKRLRSNDAYTPGARAGYRPDRAATVYTRILKKLYPDTPVILGGIEASLRRLAHYDYWSDSIHPSILVDSGADLLVYGMGERIIPELAAAMHNGFNLRTLRKLPQVAFITDKKETLPKDAVILHPFEKTVENKKAFADNFVLTEAESNKINASHIVEPYGDKYIVINPPYRIISTENIDKNFDLPYTRLPHPRYRDKEAIPAYDMIRHSVNIHRGCFGGCSFCTISMHQGKQIVSRSEQSILSEVKAISEMEDFRGNLSDLGGPSANMYGMGGKDRSVCANCARPSCIYPAICRNLDTDHRPLLDLYKKVRDVKGVKKVFIGSGIRYDMFIDGRNDDYLREVIINHTSGRLKVAPEHTEPGVLKLMRKPGFEQFEKLHGKFRRICTENGLKYQLVPYFISSHPGCTERDMRLLAEKTGRLDVHMEQVQDFTPTPMTLSSVMFYTGIDPYTGKPLYVARDSREKQKQKGWFFRR